MDSRHLVASTGSKVTIAVGVMLAAVCFGAQANLRLLGLLAVGIGMVILLRRPILGLLVLVVAALVFPIEFSTGTDVALNSATLLVPILLAVWALDMVRRRELQLVPSRTNLPLLLFLIAGMFSLLVGIVTWDPGVPRDNGFIVVQLAQWGIFALSAGAFWLAGNLVRDEIWLRRLTFFFLALAGSLAILLVLPGGDRVISHVITLALVRAPFWVLLGALAGGQLLFNRQLSRGWRLFLLAAMGAVLVYAFYRQRYATANWVGVVVVAGVLVWLRWRRLRWGILGLAVLGLIVFSPTVYRFAGGDAEWAESGGARIALIERVIEVSMCNPITGLGPAAYRPYARMRPLLYGGANWVTPQISSHNNYVDLFSQVGLVGLGLFLWFAAEVTWLGLRLRSHFHEGFSSGYLSAVLAAWAGALAIMVLNDWILPFVYNIGFPGFQASVLVWLFLGGLVSLSSIASQAMLKEETDDAA